MYKFRMEYSDDRDAFSARLRAVLSNKDWTQQKLAKALGVSQATLSKWLSGTQGRSYERGVAADKVLAEIEKKSGGGTPAELFEPELPREPENIDAPPLAPNAAFGEQVRFPRRRLPVYGQAVGGEDGRFILNGQRLADVLCPPALENVRDAYAVFIHGSSMEPRYYAGETAWVHPHLPIRSGDFVVAQIQNDEPGEPPLGFVKKFISKNGRELVLEQLNPPEGEDRLMRFPAEKVISIHKIVLSGLS